MSDYNSIDIFNNLIDTDNFIIIVKSKKNNYYLKCINKLLKDEYEINLYDKNITNIYYFEINNNCYIVIIYINGFSIYELNQKEFIYNYQNVNKNIYFNCCTNLKENLYFGSNKSLIYNFNIPNKLNNNRKIDFPSKLTTHIIDIAFNEKNIIIINELSEICYMNNFLRLFDNNNKIPIKIEIINNLISVAISDGSIFLIKIDEDLLYKKSLIHIHSKEISCMKLYFNINTNYYELLSGSYDGYHSLLIIKTDNREEYDITSNRYLNSFKNLIVGISYQYDLKKINMTVYNDSNLYDINLIN